MGSTHHERPAGVARSLQPGKDGVCAANAQCSDVLNQHPIRLALPHDPQHVVPEPTSLASEASTAPGAADVLAREAAADQARHGDAVGTQTPCGQSPDVGITRDAGPVALQDGAGERIRFAERNRVQPGALEPERQAANPAEQVKDAHKR